MSKLEDARNCILQNAFMSAGACGVLKGFVPIPWIEVGALTFITKRMCDKIARIYGYESLSGMSTFFGVVVGAATGAKLAAGILDVIPGLNIGANAIATFTLHTVTGIIVISACELLDEGLITDKNIRNSTAGTISKILGAVTAVVSGFVRGNYYEAVQTVKDAFHESMPEGVRASAELTTDVVEDEVKRHILTRAADEGKSIVEEIAIESSQMPRETVVNHSVANILDYNEFLKYTYLTALGSLEIGQPLEDVLAAASVVYQRINERNCIEGFWSSEQGFDDTLALYIAGYIKANIICYRTSVVSEKELAYALSKYIQRSMV